MSSWHFRSELARCPATAAALTGLLAGTAALPWLADVPPPAAGALGLLALVALPSALRSVPGPGCEVAALAGGPDGLVLLPSGRDARPLPATRVLPGLVLLVAEAEGRRRVLWIPRRALPPADFRRLKAVLLARRAGPGDSA